MSNVYINAIYSHILPERKQRPVRERYKEYYRDLYKLYNKYLSGESFYEGPGYSFTELGESVLDRCHDQGVLQDIDLVVVVYWGHEFDPDHSSCGPYFAEKYQIKGPILDVCDQGPISLFTGLHLIQQYIKNGSSQKALLLALEQTSIPRDKNDPYPLPSKNLATAIVVSQENKNRDFLIKEVNILQEQKLFSEFDPGSYLIKQSTVLFKKTSFVYKKIMFSGLDLALNNFLYLAQDYGYSPVISHLQQIINKELYLHTPIMIFDENIDNNNTGYLILE